MADRRLLDTEFYPPPPFAASRRNVIRCVNPMAMWFLILLRASAVMLGLALGFLPLDLSATSPLGDSTATTEFSCNFGMAKGEAKQSCSVPVPHGCVVAHFPGTTRPWSNISKGGATICQFNEKDTDWKTRVTGTCGRCVSEHCSARFGVMFDCSQRK